MLVIVVVPRNGPCGATPNHWGGVQAANNGIVHFAWTGLMYVRLCTLHTDMAACSASTVVQHFSLPNSRCFGSSCDFCSEETNCWCTYAREPFQLKWNRPHPRAKKLDNWKYCTRNVLGFGGLVTLSVSATKLQGTDRLRPQAQKRAFAPLFLIR